MAETAVGTGNSLVKSGAPWLRPHHFKPGQSGNPSGRPKGIVARATRRHLLARTADGTRAVDELVAAQLDKGITMADTAAFVALRDTADGRPSSQDDNGGAQIGLFVQLEVMGK